jgi:short subunit dehydrogenase-like uncharacterized protein
VSCPYGPFSALTENEYGQQRQAQVKRKICYRQIKEQLIHKGICYLQDKKRALSSSGC